MFKLVVRPVARSVTAARFTRLATAARGFTAAAVRLGEHGSVEKHEILQGPGVPKDGKVGTAYDQSTGLERAQLLEALENKQLFDMGPLEINAKGTKQSPIIVESDYNERIVGCQGHPEEQHELVWIKVERSHGIDRCPECGNVFKLGEPRTY
ncbi:Cytochrome c oxidase subunit 4 [Spiromyces aspiralis]|uniref:Cytochrome c oxidase subunit 4 n=1 Tax=Spiromyces aspiralis TaxID=68401 RepID=A0ACC1HVR0_9FUNG|nr:Cytochrome c oxidase subunit 4 [Spiromyces aspiralis]